MDLSPVTFLIGFSIGIAAANILSREARVNKNGVLHTFFVGLLIVAVIAFCTFLLSQRTPEVIVREDTVIRNIAETQQQLREQGYDIAVDGEWGPATDRAYCNYMARQCFEPEYYNDGGKHGDTYHDSIIPTSN